jgi:hypothetical protein
VTKLYIPRLGDQLRLAADWTFRLFGESRNWGLYDHLKLERRTTNGYYDPAKFREASIPAGETLKVDRIYIRRGQADFDSVTFQLVGRKTKAKRDEREHYWKPGETYTYVTPSRAVRFWAKLDDVNGMEFEQA